MDKSIGDIGKMQGIAAANPAIARPDHGAKHMFIVPGMVLAYPLRGLHTTSLLSGTIIFLEWIGLVAVGLTCAFAASKVTQIVACLFALQGIVYNVPGARTKDKAYTRSCL